MIDFQSSSAVIAHFERAAEALRGAPMRSGCAVQLPAHGRLLATGDLHDNPFHFDKIVKLARLDDSEENHVVLHELIHGDRLINGMDFSYRMLARVAELVVERPAQVHPMLANHELAQMTGRGVSKGGGNSVEFFRDALEYVFGDDAGDVEAAINLFFRAMPLAVRSVDGVLCAHSVPRADQMPRFDPAVLDRELVDEDYRGPTGAAYLMTWGRGQTPEQFEALAEAWDVRLFILGHDFAETGIMMKSPRALVLNSDHDRATVIPIDLADIPTAEQAFMMAVPLSAVS